MAGEVTVLAPKPVDMSSVAGTHAVEREHQLPKSSSGVLHGVHACMRMPPAQVHT